MAYPSLREFIQFLESKDALRRVTEPVSPALEITEIQTRLLAEGGPAVLFENVIGEDGRKFAFPVLANLFGTTERVAWAMGRELGELRALGEMLAFLNHPEPPESVRGALDMLPLVKTVLTQKPKTVKRAPCQDVVLQGDEIDLAALPVQTCWPGEPSPLITWPLVVTRAPGEDESEDGGEGGGDAMARFKDYNLGIYRMQVTGRNTTLMRWLRHRGGAHHIARWRDAGADKVPVAAVIGADPATIIAAVTPVPEAISEYQFAGILRGKRVELCDCITIPLKVPAAAEIVLEGHVSLTETGEEGPFADHTGYYNAVDTFPVFTISAITMRSDPIYLSTFTGRPPDEPSMLGQALNQVFVPLLIKQFPEITDFYLPPEGCSYRIAVVSIRKSYPGHAKRIMMAIWSYLRQFLYTKFVIVVDDDIDVHDWSDVMWAVATRMDPARDITIIENTPIDSLDFASTGHGLGGKAGLDATTKIGAEISRTWGTQIRMTDDIIDQVTNKWPSLGLPGSGKPIWKK